VPGGLVQRHRLWYAEERAVHDRLFAKTPISQRDQQRIRASRAMWFMRIGLTRADIGFALARLGEAILASPLDCVRVAAIRLPQRFGREATETLNPKPVETQ